MYFIFSPAALLVLSLVTVVVCEEPQWQTDERCLGKRDRRRMETAVVSPNNKNDGKAPMRLRRNSVDLAFQVKLHWQEGYCWQEEWIERQWCWKCVGNYCNEGDRIEIFECNETSPIQKWVYYPEQQVGLGRMSPQSNQDLCFERLGYKTWYLQWCNSSDTNQLVKGWKPIEPFELFPEGQRERCFSQHHDPRSGEVVYPEICDDARDDFTSFWEVYKPQGSLLPTLTSRPPPSRCVIPLGMVSDDTIFPGQSITSPNDSTLSLHQWSNGTIAVIENGALLWNSSEVLEDKHGDYMTILQGDGNLITWRNVRKGNKRSVAWKSRARGDESETYFLGIDCTYQYIGIYPGTPSNPGKILWSGETTRPVPKVY